MDEPLEPATAKALALQALTSGAVIFDDHVRQRIAQRSVGLLDVHRVMRGGAYQQGELANGSWRYPIWTPSITVVIAFRSFGPAVVAVVTVIRHGR